MNITRAVTVRNPKEYKRDYVHKNGGGIMRATKMNIAWTGQPPALECTIHNAN